MTASPGPDDARPSPWRWWVCGLLFLATTLNYMDRVALNQLALRIQLAFGLDNRDYSRLETGFVLAFGVGTLFFGWLVDRVSVRWVYPLAVFGWSAAGFLTGFAPGYWTLFACRIGLGLCEAGNWPCGIRTTRQVMAPAERSLGNSLFQSGTAIGAVVTPFIVLACVTWADPGEAERNAHLAVGGGAAVSATGVPPDAWQVPFRAIGFIGIIWVALWVVTVPNSMLRHTPTSTSQTAPPFTAVFRDRRFWVLVVVICGVNTWWHTYRVWLPLFLQTQRGYTEAEMSYFTMGYYLFADVGSWAIGFATLWLTWRGFTNHRARVRAFAACTALVPLSFAVPWLDGWAMSVAVYAIGFGALGLFPTYFALSQELSAAHQGKVTGTLGFLNSLWMGGVYAVQGWAIDAAGKDYQPVLALAGLPAVAALGALLVWWREPAAPVTPAAAVTPSAG